MTVEIPSGIPKLDEARQRALADPGETLEVEGGAAIRPDAEGVVTPDFQEIGHQLELPGDLEVLHRAGRR